jgi:hypothetical protein
MKWISIKEKLPKQGQEVLVWANKVEGEIYYEVSEPSCVKVEFKTLEYSSVVDCDYYEVFASGITHWQPLPKAPK